MTVDYTDSNAMPQQDALHFFYDAQSRPAQINFNGVIYTYVHNLQGDIVGLLDSAGALTVEYRYDAWGKPLSVTGNLADTLGKRNPFRYRGYVYDEETGLYYLRSRYYNPEVGRFVNADGVLGSKLLTTNIFAYCLNRPTTKVDKSGQFAATITGGWLVSGGWAVVASAAKAAGAFLLKVLGTTAAAGVTAVGINRIAKSVSSSNADERTDVAPAPAPAPTIKPSATASPKTTPNPNQQLPDYPGDDPEVAPDGYEWRGRGPRGSSQGNYHNPETGESLHPDLTTNHPLDHTGIIGILLVPNSESFHRIKEAYCDYLSAFYDRHTSQKEHLSGISD